MVRDAFRLAKKYGLHTHAFNMVGLPGETEDVIRKNFELLAEIPDLDALVVPVGGGGLLSGSSIAAAALRPGMRLFAGEPELADDAFRSLETGVLQPPRDPRTVADGLRTALSELTFSIIRAHAARIVLVSEEQILAATRLIWTRAKLVVEPSGAVPLAAVLRARAELEGLKVGVILTGGNVDPAGSV